MGFIADRMLFLPAGAGAATLPQDGSEASVEATPAAPGSVNPPAAGEPSGPTLSEKLAAASSAVESTRNPFQQPWRGVVTSAAATADVKEPGVLLTAAEFSARHELKAISKVNETTVAVIGKATRRVGDVVDGWTLVAIEDRSVMLERGAQKVTLALRGSSMPDNSIVPRRTGQIGPEVPDQ